MFVIFFVFMYKKPLNLTQPNLYLLYSYQLVYRLAQLCLIFLCLKSLAMAYCDVSKLLHMQVTSISRLFLVRSAVGCRQSISFSSELTLSLTAHSVPVVREESYSLIDIRIYSLDRLTLAILQKQSNSVIRSFGLQGQGYFRPYHLNAGQF